MMKLKAVAPVSKFAACFADKIEIIMAIPIAPALPGNNTRPVVNAAINNGNYNE